MRVTWFPRNLLRVVAVVGILGCALRVAIDFRAGAVVGLLALLSYLALESGLTFNPGVWGRRGKP